MFYDKYKSPSAAMNQNQKANNKQSPSWMDFLKIHKTKMHGGLPKDLVPKDLVPKNVEDMKVPKIDTGLHIPKSKMHGGLPGQGQPMTPGNAVAAKSMSKPSPSVGDKYAAYFPEESIRPAPGQQAWPPQGTPAQETAPDVPADDGLFTVTGSSSEDLTKLTPEQRVARARAAMYENANVREPGFRDLGSRASLPASVAKAPPAQKPSTEEHGDGLFYLTGSKEGDSKLSPAEREKRAWESLNQLHAAQPSAENSLGITPPERGGVPPSPREAMAWKELAEINARNPSDQELSEQEKNALNAARKREAVRREGRLNAYGGVMGPSLRYYDTDGVNMTRGDKARQEALIREREAINNFRRNISDIPVSMSSAEYDALAMERGYAPDAQIDEMDAREQSRRRLQAEDMGGVPESVRAAKEAGAAEYQDAAQEAIDRRLPGFGPEQRRRDTRNARPYGMGSSDYESRKWKYMDDNNPYKGMTEKQKLEAKRQERVNELAPYREQHRQSNAASVRAANEKSGNNQSMSQEQEQKAGDNLISDLKLLDAKRRNSGARGDYNEWLADQVKSGAFNAYNERDVRLLAHIDNMRGTNFSSLLGNSGESPSPSDRVPTSDRMPLSSNSSAGNPFSSSWRSAGGSGGRYDDFNQRRAEKKERQAEGLAWRQAMARDQAEIRAARAADSGRTVNYVDQFGNRGTFRPNTSENEVRQRRAFNSIAEHQKELAGLKASSDLAKETAAIKAQQDNEKQELSRSQGAEARKAATMILGDGNNSEVAQAAAMDSLSTTYPDYFATPAGQSLSARTPKATQQEITISNQMTQERNTLKDYDLFAKVAGQDVDQITENARRFGIDLDISRISGFAQQMRDELSSLIVDYLNDNNSNWSDAGQDWWSFLWQEPNSERGQQIKQIRDSYINQHRDFIRMADALGVDMGKRLDLNYARPDREPEPQRPPSSHLPAPAGPSM